MLTFLARTFASALLIAGLAGPAAAADAPATPANAASAPVAPLDTRVQALKAELVRLNRDLLVLEEELLFPPGTQVAVFLSLDVGKPFELESVRVMLNDNLLASHIYTAAEVQALQRGGVQRLHLGNLRSGKHQIAAHFTGRSPQDRDYKRSAKVEFDKGSDAKVVELKIRDKEGKLQPEFEVKVWP